MFHISRKNQETNQNKVLTVATKKNLEKLMTDLKVQTFIDLSEPVNNLLSAATNVQTAWSCAFTIFSFSRVSIFQTWKKITTENPN